MNPASIERDSVGRGPSVRDVLAGAWPALVLAFACLLPFLNKAYLVDDPHFLAMARQIIRHPLHPMDFELCWNLIDRCTRAYEWSGTMGWNANVLMGYALVPTVMRGSGEWIAHVTQMIFVGIAIVAMTSLVLRLGWDRTHAMLGALLLAAIPPFLPMASTAMPDVLAAAITVVAIERLVAWRAERRWHQGLVAAAALGLAGIARAQLVLVLPLAAFFLMESLDPRQILLQVRRDLRLWIPVLAGGAIFLSIVLLTREQNIALGPPPVFKTVNDMGRNLRSYFLYLCFPLPLSAVWAANRWITRPRIVVHALLTGVLVGLLVPGKLTGFFAGIAFTALADLAMEVWTKRDGFELCLLLWLLIPLPIVYYSHLPIKYFLPSMPAIILMCFRLAESIPARMTRVGAVVLIVSATVYSMLILRSDAEFADFGRSAMAELIRPHTDAGETVWSGDDFSAYWYAPLNGARRYRVGASEAKPGDLLVVGVQEDRGRTLAHFPKSRLVATVSHKYRFGRTMFNGKGLYSNGYGNWLWGFGDTDDDRYEIWKIE